MNKIEIYCTTIKYYKVMEKLPNYIIPLGLGEEKYPDNWLIEKAGDNISALNKYYAEFTGFYWIWKNKISNLNDNDLIGNCHNRVLWLNNYIEKKKKFTSDSLYKNFLSIENKILKDVDVIQVQPIIFKEKNLLQDFEEIHKCDALIKSIEFLDKNLSKKFLKHLEGNYLFPHNMFITKKRFFIEYCEIIFPWLEKCLAYCKQKNLCENYNLRLPAFLAERLTSFWFSEFKNRKLLSYARLGKIHLSNNINKFINSTKLPFTFYQYPTIHRY